MSLEEANVADAILALQRSTYGSRRYTRADASHSTIASGLELLHFGDVSWLK